MATNQTFVDYQTPIPADWLNNVNNKVNILANKGTNIASAAAINLGAATGDYVVITGTTTITSLGTADAGTERTLVFSGVLTLTHNATSLILPGGVDIITAAGDTATFRSEGAGNWRCTGYQPNINGLKLGGTAARITGDFSSSPVSNRVMFQTSVANNETNVAAIPNGTSQSSRFTAFGASDPANASLTQIYTDQLTGFSVLRAGATGSGSNLPLSFTVGGTERMRIDTSGNVLVTSASGGLGYGIGAGGTVTQSTSKSTAVTLNKPCGQITMNNAALAAGALVAFNLNNSLLATSDGLVVCPVSIGNYRVEVAAISAGVAQIRVTNITAGSLSEALVINFAIIKGSVL